MTGAGEPELFVLDRIENPHPVMLAAAVKAREDARRDLDGAGSYWDGYLAAMCAATGEAAEAIEAWMDRNS